ncbi:hypothetical protein A3D72_03240 [Candidatus Uhrbacteria bacterium RIFCSPHIGHO2_02_FULL_57_19]|uniref:HAD family hydrolase n=1 Tax=Candidatus Uhrbacteria bacterium RIFCSPHIGHO2_02_FULL_57_19 TaxID=1802391 RepID=A0A1F7U6P4_9BACT|nr:MAG: hypothetical protein A3D72_03240 [Candidatus Uhrbacteria bacterium RIFCSPHIGHO2_02_FULL_57_19]
MAIRTLFVDLGGVVVKYKNDITLQGLAALSDKSAAEVEQLIFAKLDKEFDEGLLNEREFFAKALLELGTVILEDEFWGCWKNIFQADEGVVQILHEARGNGVEVIAASNIDPKRFESIRDTGCLAPFHKLGLSFQMKTRKPFKTFFERLMRMTETPLAECLFVDDLMKNTDSAIDFGLTSLLFITPDALRRVLRGYGVLP